MLHLRIWLIRPILLSQRSISCVQPQGSDEPTVIVGEVNDISMIDLEPRSNKLTIIPESEHADQQPTRRKSRPEEIAMTQAVLYGARIGGGAILTGNITNLLLLDFIDRLVLTVGVHVHL